MTTRVPASMISAVVTPESFGAIGNGSTDDTAALNAAATAAGAWGQVFLNPAKTYRITASITPLTGQRWYGGGKITTANGFNFNAFDLIGKTDVTIEGLRGESGYLASLAATSTARFVSAKSLSHRCKVIGCHVTGFQSAIQFNNSTDCKALNNTIVNPIAWGINVQTDADYAEVRGNRIAGMAPVVITGITNANPAVVTTATAHGFVTGDQVIVRDVVGMTNGALTVNNTESLITVLSATTFSLTTFDSTAYTAYTSGGITRNRLIEHGIYLAGSAANNVLSPIVADNWVSNTGVDGIKVTRADDTLVRGNRCFSVGGDGIYVTVSATRTEVVENVSQSNLGNGIIVYTGTAADAVDRTRVLHNVVRKNGKNGISVTDASTGAVTNTTVEGNDVDDNDQEAAGTNYGIVLGGGSSNTGSVVTGNRVANEVTGIVVASGVVSARLQNNVFAGNTTNITDSGTTTVIDQVTRGVTASVADGGTITHGHPKTPTSVTCTSSVSGEFISVTAISATTFTVAIKKHDNSAGTTQSVYWEAAG